jgi:hypothetical protein
MREATDGVAARHTLAVAGDGCMTKLEDLRPNAAVRGILADSLVSVVSVQWFGSEAL